MTYGTKMLALGVLLFGTSAGTAAIVDLGSLRNFAIFADTIVTNTGPSAVVGNIGTSSTTALSGFGNVALIGSVHAGDAVAQQAAADWKAAFASGNAASCTADLTGQDLGGMTLTAGTYCFSSNAQLTGRLTLDAGGDPAAQFLFRTGSTLTTATASSVAWTGGAGDAVWLIGSAATLGTATEFSGSILAATAITLDTGASISRGRALAGSGAVSLDSSSIAVDSAAVPEPATWTLLLTGFAVVGRQLRRRRAIDAEMSRPRNFCAPVLAMV